MHTEEFIEMIKTLMKEKKELQKRLDIMEEILRSYLPIIEEKNNES